MTTHMCRVNYRSSWAAEGGYDFVAEALFGQLDVDGFFLEYDDARSGDFAPLRFVPPGKFVVLGLITTKSADLESKDALKRRIDEAARYVPLEQLCLSPQCGFSSTVEGNVLTRDEQIAKLRLVVAAAQEIGLDHPASLNAQRSRCVQGELEDARRLVLEHPKNAASTTNLPWPLAPEYARVPPTTR